MPGVTYTVAVVALIAAMYCCGQLMITVPGPFTGMLAATDAVIFVSPHATNTGVVALLYILAFVLAALVWNCTFAVVPVAAIVTVGPPI